MTNQSSINKMVALVLAAGLCACGPAEKPREAQKLRATVLIACPARSAVDIPPFSREDDRIVTAGAQCRDSEAAQLNLKVKVEALSENDVTLIGVRSDNETVGVDVECPLLMRLVINKNNPVAVITNCVGADGRSMVRIESHLEHPQRRAIRVSLSGAGRAAIRVPVQS